MTTFKSAELSDLETGDLVVTSSHVAMVIKAGEHPQIQFLETGYCCSMVQGPITLISEADRDKYKAEYPEGYDAALAAMN